MKKIKKQVSVIHVKNRTIMSTSLSEQTQKNRDKINSKIRILGDKYYKTKNFLEKLNIKRDGLFELGKHLEAQFKDAKKGIRLQAQSKRMKEALYVWFAENFYDEIFEENSFIENMIKQKGIDKEKTDENPIVNHDNELPDLFPLKSSSDQPFYPVDDFHEKPPPFNEDFTMLTSEDVKVPDQTENKKDSIEFGSLLKEIENSNCRDMHIEYADVFYF